MTTWNLSDTKSHILICNGSSCMRKGGEEVTAAIRDEISKLQLDPSVHTTRTRCNGRCKDACIVIQYPEGNWYKAMSPELGRKLVQSIHEEAELLPESVLYAFEGDSFIKVSGESEQGKNKPVKAGC
ncbi:(2Fe-2S) ferredoxin domain-containing protein [Bacillus massilinigeriensis]|uniref:(2Fe-2S) ferredoxin domain-containing protein n=1 Tax=Bacillus mediterraneensis TaxID=1805474 RepID=UPI0008F806E7|nr:(2Fe-2S) ferredoxin domain-containing protein [Bacillus mediterraneensis]